MSAGYLEHHVGGGIAQHALGADTWNHARASVAILVLALLKWRFAERLF